MTQSVEAGLIGGKNLIEMNFTVWQKKIFVCLFWICSDFNLFRQTVFFIIHLNDGWITGQFALAGLFNVF